VAGPSHGDGLVRWLVGGLVAGGIVLGLMVAAYAIGYHRGKEHGRSASPRPAAPAQTTTTAAGPAARGERLFTADGCSGCHSLDGAAGAGPTVKGLAGSRVELADGSTTTADGAYLTRAIADPDAQIVKGYTKGVMSAAISSFDLAGKPQDVAALVAFIKARR
jgi:mono/diheme cytochrome c family protein